MLAAVQRSPVAVAVLTALLNDAAGARMLGITYPRPIAKLALRKCSADRNTTGDARNAVYFRIVFGISVD